MQDNVNEDGFERDNDMYQCLLLMNQKHEINMHKRKSVALSMS